MRGCVIWPAVGVRSRLVAAIAANSATGALDATVTTGQSPLSSLHLPDPCLASLLAGTALCFMLCCVQVLRNLPPLAKQYVMRLLLLDAPLAEGTNRRGGDGGGGGRTSRSRAAGHKPTLIPDIN